MITDDQINEASEQYDPPNIEAKGFEEVEQAFSDGCKWRQEQAATDFLTFIQSTGLDQKEKDMIRGVFYDWQTS